MTFNLWICFFYLRTTKVKVYQWVLLVKASSPPLQQNTKQHNSLATDFNAFPMRVTWFQATNVSDAGEEGRSNTPDTFVA